jgi:RimJ/RimL family protein N-acetyltransferase
MTRAAIRALGAEDGEAFRALRLEALRDSPTAFGASYDDEVRLAPGDFARRIQPTEASWVLGAFDGNGRLVGCIGWYRDRGAKVAHKSHVWGMYVTPLDRRNGVARDLLAELMTRVRGTEGVTRVELFVASGNERAAKLYAQAGFERVAVLPESLFVDGRFVDEALFALRLA